MKLVLVVCIVWSYTSLRQAIATKDDISKHPFWQAINGEPLKQQIADDNDSEISEDLKIDDDIETGEDYETGGDYGIDIGGDYGIDIGGDYGIDIGGDYGIDIGGDYESDDDYEIGDDDESGDDMEIDDEQQEEGRCTSISSLLGIMHRTYSILSLKNSFIYTLYSSLSVKDRESLDVPIKYELWAYFSAENSYCIYLIVRRFGTYICLLDNYCKKIVNLTTSLRIG